MKRIAKLTTAFLSVIAAVSCMCGINANALNEGTITCNSSSSTLTSNYSLDVWGDNTFAVYNRSTGSQVYIVTNNGLLSQYTSRTASIPSNVTPYSPVTYRFQGTGVLHSGVSYYSPTLWSGTATY